MGAADFCDEGKGGVTIITLGDFRVASGLQVNGGTLDASGDIQCGAQGSGLSGINIVASGEFDNTSNGSMGFCNFGPPSPIVIPVFKTIM